MVDTYVCISKKFLDSITRIVAHMRDSVFKRWDEPLGENDKIGTNPFKDFLELVTVELYCGRQIERVLLGGFLPDTSLPRQVRSKDIDIFAIIRIVFP